MKNKIFALHEGAKKSALPARLNDRVSGSLIALCLISASAVDSAEQEPAKLPDTTIIANRIATPLSQVGSSVSVLDVAELADQGILQLDEALKFAPGVVSESIGGQRGSYSYTQIRGMEAKDTALFVDGMRISGGPDQFISQYFLGSQNTNGLSQIEVLRGPQGVMYGPDTMGGVIGLYSAKGEGPHSGELRLETGSFNSQNAMLGMQGTEGDLSYSLSLGYEETENDTSKYKFDGEKDNDFDMFSYALRLDYAVNKQLNIGMTLRGAEATYIGPNIAGYGPDVTDTDYTLGTVFAEYELNEQWLSKLTLGIYQQNTFFNQPDSLFTSDEDLAKFALYWDNTYQWNDRHTTLFGLTYEDSSYTGESSFSDADNNRTQSGVYANHIWQVTDNFNVSGGLRWENYDEDRQKKGQSREDGYDDDHVTWKLASAYTAEKTSSILRASIGTGFRLPAVSQIVGSPNPFFGPAILPNDDLDPQESIGWDLGVEQPFCDGKYGLSVTYFANRVDGQIYNTGTQYVNADSISEISGIEASAEANFLDDRLNITLSYTWLDRSPLIDLPENVLGLRVHGQISDRLSLGLSASFMDSRSMGAPSDTYAGNLESYVLVNLFGHYQLTENVKLTARVENLLDTDYELFNQPAQGGLQEASFPGRGVGIFGGVTIEW
jgi:vitamin B12 transporter